MQLHLKIEEKKGKINKKICKTILLLKFTFSVLKY